MRGQLALVIAFSGIVLAAEALATDVSNYTFNPYAYRTTIPTAPPATPPVSPTGPSGPQSAARADQSADLIALERKAQQAVEDGKLDEAERLFHQLMDAHELGHSTMPIRLEYAPSGPIPTVVIVRDRSSQVRTGFMGTTTIDHAPGNRVRQRIDYTQMFIEGGGIRDRAPIRITVEKITDSDGAPWVLYAPKLDLPVNNPFRSRAFNWKEFKKAFEEEMGTEHQVQCWASLRYPPGEIKVGDHLSPRNTIEIFRQATQCDIAANRGDFRAISLLSLLGEVSEQEMRRVLALSGELLGVFIDRISKEIIERAVQGGFNYDSDYRVDGISPLGRNGLIGISGSYSYNGGKFRGSAVARNLVDPATGLPYLSISQGIMEEEGKKTSTLHRIEYLNVPRRPVIPPPQVAITPTAPPPVQEPSKQTPTPQAPPQRNQEAAVPKGTMADHELLSPEKIFERVSPSVYAVAAAANLESVSKVMRSGRGGGRAA
jgi:hypothetical protein